MKITFIKSPTASLKLAYSAGEKANITDKLAKELIKDGYAIADELSEEEKAEAAEKAAKLKAEKEAKAKAKAEAKAAAEKATKETAPVPQTKN